MTRTELLAAFRSDMSDTVEPHLWTDEDIDRYADDAQEMFCQLTDGIADSSSAATQLAIVPGTEWYDTDPSILKIRTVTRADTGRDVSVVNPETMAEHGVVFDAREGPLRALVLGLEENKVRAWPIPSETVTVNLSVFRGPLEPFSSSEEFEVGARHHVHLLHWIKSRAYLKQDAETFDKSRSEDFEIRFRSYCAEAMKQQSRARRTTGTVVYNGL